METIGYVKEFTLTKKVKKEIFFYNCCTRIKYIVKNVGLPYPRFKDSNGCLIGDSSYLANKYLEIPYGDIPVRRVMKLENGCVYAAEVETKEEDTYRFYTLSDANYATKDADGTVYLYKCPPSFAPDGFWAGTDGRRSPELEHLFKDIPHKESLAELRDVTEE